MACCKKCGSSWCVIDETTGICENCRLHKKAETIERIVNIATATGMILLVAVPILLILGLVFLTWDYHTGQDTGYISAVDKMTFSEDKKIYLRRRPLDSFMTTEEDEHVYCTTSDREDVIEKAYKAMESGKRVVVIYNEARPFGWRNWGHCDQAPITDIKVVEEDS